MADQRANRAEFGKKLQGPLFPEECRPFPKDAVDFNLPKKVPTGMELAAAP
jgi:hypothetical protein